MNKSGISAIVATVLIILITVAAVAILWGAIFPLVHDLSKVKTSESAVSIVTAGGYTLYDDVQKIACVQVVKQTSEDLEGLKVLFSIAGNSQFSVINRSDVPEMNQKRTYCFNLTNFGKPETVTVVSLPEAKSVAVSSVIKVESLSEVALNSIVSGGNLRKIEDPNLVPQITYYFDSDQDGYSNGTISRNFEEGTQWSNYTLVLGDCNDFNSSIRPGASEVLNNGVDENCDGWAAINQCMVLSQENARYSLISDISGGVRSACIFIDADNITFNGQGHTINVTFGGRSVYGQYGAGIASEYTTQGKIMNATVTNAKSQGVYLGGVENYTISNINSSGCIDYHGLLVYSSNYLLIENNIFNDNDDWGILFWGASNVTLKGNVICNNSVDITCWGASVQDGGNKYSTQTSCDGWVMPSTGAC